MAAIEWNRTEDRYPDKGRRVRWKNENAGTSGVIEKYSGSSEGGIDNAKCKTTHWRYVDACMANPEASVRQVELTPEQRKAHPLFRGLHGYFPDACMAVANCSFVANEQHNPGEPMHWAREKSTDHEDCIFRHLSDRQKNRFDTDKIRHATKAAWRALALLQLEIEEDRKLGALVEELDEIPKDEERPDCVPEGVPWTYATDGLGRRVAIWIAAEDDEGPFTPLVRIEDPKDPKNPWVWGNDYCEDFDEEPGEGVLTPSLSAECQVFYDKHRS